MIVTAWDRPAGRLLAGLLGSLAAVGEAGPVRVLVPDAAAAERVGRFTAPADTTAIVADFVDQPGKLAYDGLMPRLPQLVGSDGGPVTWLDPGTWVQEAGAIAPMQEGAAGGALVAAFPIDRGYRSMASDTSPWHVHRAAIHRAYGPKMAEHTWTRPAVEIGVFTLRGDARHWQFWQAVRDEAVQRGVTPGPGLFSLSAVTLHMAIWRHQLPLAPLPARWNWLCHLGRPMRNGRRLVEPAPPYDPIAILHLSGPEPGRPAAIRDRAGRLYKTNLCFPPTFEPLAEPPP
ncbi:hypothetical protein EDC65_1995 [Stella humosa]|uniref:Uncharacterized protein n=1 Tax=Stella humosa TaxID=94 RepID=A0A3N1MAB4_9PROT|nr:hypothetical protein [Stella humosa]ROQ00199.1 hypothetical protein EDC65_1995 [Stella humosa]BBK30566.1 hypothetical protein STHU_12000 [Stella humosa]